MIKIVQVSTSYNETKIKISYSYKGSNHDLTIRKGDLDDRLREVKAVLGRRITKNDYRQAIITLVNEVRNGRYHVSDNIDFSSFIGVDLE